MGRYVARDAVVPGLMSLTQAAELCSDEPGATEVEWTVVDAAIEAAEALVDGYVSRRYNMPLPSVPALVSRAAARLARAELYMRRPGGPDKSVTEDAAAVLGQLEQIAAGSIGLGLTAAGEGTGAKPAARVRSSGEPRALGRRPLAEF